MKTPGKLSGFSNALAGGLFELGADGSWRSD
jgi:hypothetical protein